VKKALLTGITGQDGSYLADLLLSKDYEVHGVIRRASSFNTARVDHIFEHPNLHLHHGDVLDCANISSLVLNIEPDEIYNLAAQSHVRVSFDLPLGTVDSIAMGTLHVLEAARQLNRKKLVKVYQASSSEMFGNSPPPQNEQTNFNPRSPYGCAKAYAHYQTINYREAYGLFACCGILFNHESPRRGETFVTRKITRALGRIYVGLQADLKLGNLDAKRDWGFAGDYVRAMWMMLQQDTPDDYVIATGETYSVKDFLSKAFSNLGLNWEDYVLFDQNYVRPSEVDCLLGDASKAQKLGWKPEVSFDQLVEMMVKSDIELALQEKKLI